MSSTTIRDFWLSHPEYHITIGESQQLVADKDIFERFADYAEHENEDVFGQVIYLDQFVRHIWRHRSNNFSTTETATAETAMTETATAETATTETATTETATTDTVTAETTIRRSRQRAVDVVVSNMAAVYASPDSEIVWYLMPFKHLAMWDSIFPIIDEWVQRRRATTPNQTIVQFPHLYRFYVDTYKKAYTYERILTQIEYDPMTAAATAAAAEYDPATICESYPDEYRLGQSWTESVRRIPDCANPLQSALNALLGSDPQRPIAISLSGGVDSMVMTALLSHMSRRESATPTPALMAVHIVYNNRPESLQEKSFVAEYCRRLQIPVRFYTIRHLRRDSVKRDFYETMTREIRFNVYRAMRCPILLGHIRDDVVENVWTNFAHGTHLDNLAKFEPVTTESGVEIWRPWLSITKHAIYETADRMAIPHLKNTTPSWSNRGKFRERFYSATHAQFESGVDDTVIAVSDRLRRQSELLRRLLFEPILESWDSELRQIDITEAFRVKLDGDGWLTILTEIAHRHLHVSKPSYASCDSFADRIGRQPPTDGAVFHFKRGFVGIVIAPIGQQRVRLRFR
jgi:tRNA(Ile)-lysidine synthetase-like protein